MTAASDLRFHPSGDGELAYRDTGSGDLVVLLHSGFVDHRLFDAQTTALAARHRVVAPDTRGHGFSANASGPFRWADDLAGLLRALDAGPAVLVGLSMGGGIAVDTVLEHPDLVRGLVVASAATSEFTYTDPWVRGIRQAQDRALAGGDVEGWLREFLRYVPGPRRGFDDVAPDVLRRVREMALHTLSKHTPGEPDPHVRLTDTWERVPKIGVPLLTVNGALDTPDLLAGAERLARAVPYGRGTVLDGTAHYAPLERPDAFTAVVEDFLRGL
ncbi:alpha/beta fold hydrolase [Streptomyces mangrovisoli]|uniref:Alpha/beta hydrolase n=1 Tax=Streptomyces mangrovisoli TaxID=1428628 RepID=A0A1J4NXS8_9ACTN|nr:alpha/beta hydrolase [Streptomyces mangrovisoli]OIJ67287.1 alpha/beta hydrolase [Streptomyces mangrovisoli]